MMVKHDEEDIKAVGGAQNAKEFSDKFKAMISANKDLQAKLDACDQKFTALETKISGLETKLATVEQKASEQKPSAIDEVKVKEIATAAASAKVVEIHGVAGNVASTTTVTASPVESAESVNVKNLIATGKYEEAWAADENLQNEFTDPKAFAAYKRAEKKQAFSIYKPKTS